MKAFLLVGAVLVGATGCVPTSGLKSRAAFDLNCPEPQLQLHELTALTYGVRGCGRQATYIYQNGTWFMNNAPLEQQQPQPIPGGHAPPATPPWVSTAVPPTAAPPPPPVAEPPPPPVAEPPSEPAPAPTPEPPAPPAPQ